MAKLVSGVESVKEKSLHFSELVKGQIYFATLSDVNLQYFLKKSNSSLCYLYVDKEFFYQSFNRDFGPLHLGMLFQYCQKLDSIFKKKGIVVHLTTTNKEKRTNAAYLVGSYCIIYRNLTPSDIIKELKEQCVSYVAFKNFASFVHAGFEAYDFYLYLDDCFSAIYKAVKNQFLNFSVFNLHEYLFYEKVENGDFNWIMPEKFIAFCDPQTYCAPSLNYFSLYINYFRKNNVSTIVRLNRSQYKAKLFTEQGFEHHDLIFTDGSTPSDAIMMEFIRICENAPGAIAVHCKGRTGTLIACYIMKHFRFTALEAIAWIRICRPGSIIGCQQKWLQTKQSFLWSQGSMFNNTQSCQSSNRNYSNICNQSALDIENNNSELTAVKCHILNKECDQYVMESSVNSSTHANELNSLTTEVDNIQLKETSSHKSLRNNSKCNKVKDVLRSQGDLLNEIKVSRKHNTLKLSRKTHFSNFKSNFGLLYSSKSQFKNSLKSAKLDSNNNLCDNWRRDSNNMEESILAEKPLKIYGKKMVKYPSNASRSLPH